MNRKYLVESSEKVARWARLIAKLVDFFIVLILSIFFYPLGLILSIVYIGISDSLQNGQSVGKKFIGLAVISLEDGSPCSYRQSVVRNLPIMIPLFFAIIPLWGWIFAALIGLTLIILEIYLLFKLDSGHRLGDVMADTTVVSCNSEHVATKDKNSSWFESEYQEK